MIRKFYFSLIELIISLTAFTILLLMMFNLLSSSQESMSRISRSLSSYSQSRLISEYLTKDLHSLYIGPGLISGSNCPLKSERNSA